MYEDYWRYSPYKYEPEPMSGCWVWMGSLSGNGYGRFGKKVAHRVIYELLRGPIPEGMEADHMCNNIICVNPDHIRPSMPRDNKMRGNGVCALHSRKTQCVNGHEFTVENTYNPPKRPGRRYCKTCTKNRKRAALTNKEAK
jgi:hypothetical protein